MRSGSCPEAEWHLPRGSLERGGQPRACPDIQPNLCRQISRLPEAGRSLFTRFGVLPKDRKFIKSICPKGILVMASFPVSVKLQPPFSTSISCLSHTLTPYTRQNQAAASFSTSTSPAVKIEKSHLKQHNCSFTLQATYFSLYTLLYIHKRFLSRSAHKH